MEASIHTLGRHGSVPPAFFRALLSIVTGDDEIVAFGCIAVLHDVGSEVAPLDPSLPVKSCSRRANGWGHVDGLFGAAATAMAAPHSILRIEVLPVGLRCCANAQRDARPPPLVWYHLEHLCEDLLTSHQDIRDGLDFFVVGGAWLDE